MGAIFGLRTFIGTFGRRSGHYPGEESDRRLADALHVELKRIFPGPEEGREPASADRKVAQELSRALAARLSFHREGLLSSKARHDRLSFNLAWMIPVGSAIVTSIIALPRYDFPLLAKYQAFVALALTIITVFNSVLRPTEKVITATHMLVQLHDWEIGLITELRKPAPDQLDKIMELLVTKDKELSKFGIEAADRMLPQMPQHPSGQNGESPRAGAG